MSKSEWALLMSETYAKQNDMEQAEYYYNMAQFFKNRRRKESNQNVYTVQQKTTMLGNLQAGTKRKQNQGLPARSGTDKRISYQQNAQAV